MAVLSTRNSTRPPLTSLTARSRSNVIVPALGFGIRPRRPRILPSLPTMPIESGVAMRDVELEPAGLDLLDQVVAADLVGAGAERLLGLLALGEDGDPDDLAGAVREDDRAADHLVGVARVDAEPEVRLDRRRRTRRTWSAWRARPPRAAGRPARGRRASPPRGTSCRAWPCRCSSCRSGRARPPPSDRRSRPGVRSRGATVGG